MFIKMFPTTWWCVDTNEQRFVKIMVQDNMHSGMYSEALPIPIHTRAASFRTYIFWAAAAHNKPVHNAGVIRYKHRTEASSLTADVISNTIGYSCNGEKRAGRSAEAFLPIQMMVLLCLLFSCWRLSVSFVTQTYELVIGLYFIYRNFTSDYNAEPEQAACRKSGLRYDRVPQTCAAC